MEEQLGSVIVSTWFDDAEVVELNEEQLILHTSSDYRRDIIMEHLSPEIVIHRVTGDGPKDLLIAPKWSQNKRDVLNSLHKLMKERNTMQGAAL